MEASLENYDWNIKDGNMESLVKKTPKAIMSNECKQCDDESSQASNLRRHSRTHSEEKSNKCNQCDFISSQASNLRRHLKTHSDEM